MIKVLDLFSGIGGFSLAAHRAGFEVVAHCEIDAFPRAVLAYRFPAIPIFEDVKKFTKDIFYEKTGLDKIDVVVGGSPCQDFSVAGRQRGFGGDRSSLFLEQMRVARELGAKWIVWENVPGVLSSNKGEDFGRVLSEFSGWTIPAQKFGGVGFVRARTANDYSVCYRIYNTQFFGVPQRRRRIYLVASLGGECRPEILFEPDGVRGHSAAVGGARKNAAAAVAGSAGGDGCAGYKNVFIESGNAGDCVPTLIASMAKIYNKQTPILFENHGKDARYNAKDVSPGCGVRRLTPRECERLQAFPDDWTKIPYRGKSAEDCPDSLRYKACGNAITVAVGEYVLRRLRAYIDNNLGEAK